MSTYQLHIDSEIITLSKQEAESLDLITSPTGQMHLIDSNKSMNISEIISEGNSKTIRVVVNGNSYTFLIKDELDQLVDQLGMANVGQKKITNIKAPMPGLILDIMVEAGQSFKAGDPLLILEAMKMENVIKAESDGVIKSIEANKTDTVEKGQIIIELEDE